MFVDEIVVSIVVYLLFEEIYEFFVDFLWYVDYLKYLWDVW